MTSQQASKSVGIDTLLESQIHLTDAEKAIFIEARANLAYVAKKSQTASELLSFYDTNKVESTLLSNGVIQTVEGNAHQNYFFIFAMPDTVPDTIPQQVHVAATFDMSSRSLGLHEFTFNKLVGGVFLAHELQHAVDWVTGAEPYSEPYSPDWLVGELHAHRTAYQILNEFTDSLWYRNCMKSEVERESTAVAMGHRPSSFILSSIHGDSVRVAQLFKTYKLDGSFEDISALCTQMTVDANMLLIKKFANGDSVAWGNGMMEFIDAFYKRWGIDMSTVQ